jgi:hypothetical protein
MTRDHLEKINSWFMEQIEGLKAEGASEQELNDPAVADLALRKIFEKHFDEIRIDPDLIDDTFAVVSNQASPEDLREIAAQARKEGSSKLGHYLDLVAGFLGDQKEHGNSLNQAASAGGSKRLVSCR